MAKDRLKAGEALNKDEMLVSANNRFHLIMQGDGNVVLYDKKPSEKDFWKTGKRGGGTQVIWTARTHGDCRIMMQGDGNLVVTDLSWKKAVWASGTGGKGNSSSMLVMQNDGNAVISSDGVVIWMSGSRRENDDSDSGEEEPAPPKPNPAPVQAQPAKPLVAASSGGSDLQRGQYITTDQTLQSPNGLFRAILQSDGNFVIYYESIFLWASNTAPNSAIKKLVMQHDGNLVLHGWEDSVVWSSGTASDGESVLKMNNDGNLVISGSKTWSTGIQNPAFNGRITELKPGDNLYLGQKLMSPNGRGSFEFANSGNLVTTWDGKPTYHYTGIGQRDAKLLTLTKAAVRGPYELPEIPRVQIRNWKGEVIWENGGDYHIEDCRLTMDDDNCLRFRNWNRVLWTSANREFHSGSKPVLSDRLKVEESLSVGDKLVSQDWRYHCVYQADGNLVVYAGVDGSRPLWDAATRSQIPASVTQQENGNLFVKDQLGSINWRHSDGSPIGWTAMVTSKSPAETVMQDDGCLASYASGIKVWSSTRRKYYGLTGVEIDI